jgi:hypothetical protein
MDRFIFHDLVPSYKKRFYSIQVHQHPVEPSQQAQVLSFTVDAGSVNGLLKGDELFTNPNQRTTRRAPWEF